MVAQATGYLVMTVAIKYRSLNQGALIVAYYH